MLSSIISFLITIYIIIMIGMFVLQRRLMYYPETAIYEPEHYGLKNIEILKLTSEDETPIVAWLHKARKDNLPYIIYYHGNAGHVGDRAEKLKTFIDAGFGLLALSYRGFGQSKGKPYEGGLYHDARTVIDYALSEDGLNQKPESLLLYGESLGSGVATQMARELAAKQTPAGSLTLEAPYTSVARRAQEMYPFIPAYYLARDKYHSIDKIDKIDCPLLIFHGELDTVIPIHHGRKLLETAKEPKKGVFFKDVDHTQFPFSTLAEHLVEQANSHIKT